MDIMKSKTFERLVYTVLRGLLVLYFIPTVHGSPGKAIPRLITLLSKVGNIIEVSQYQ